MNKEISKNKNKKFLNTGIKKFQKTMYKKYPNYQTKSVTLFYLVLILCRNIRNSKQFFFSLIKSKLYQYNEDAFFI